MYETFIEILVTIKHPSLAYNWTLYKNYAILNTSSCKIWKKKLWAIFVTAGFNKWYDQLNVLYNISVKKRNWKNTILSSQSVPFFWYYLSMQVGHCLIASI